MLIAALGADCVDRLRWVVFSQSCSDANPWYSATFLSLLAPVQVSRRRPWPNKLAFSLYGWVAAICTPAAAVRGRAGKKTNRYSKKKPPLRALAPNSSLSSKTVAPVVRWLSYCERALAKSMRCRGRAKLPANQMTQLLRMTYIRDTVGANGLKSVGRKDAYWRG